MTRLRHAALLPLTVAVVGCGAASASPGTPAGAAAGSRLPAVGSLAAVDLGPVAATAQVEALLTLAPRNAAELDAISGTNPRLSPAEYAARFGPDPVAVAALRARLESSGLRTRWVAGDAQVDVEGPAATAQRVFGVQLHDYVSAAGRRYYSTVTPPTVPPSMRPLVVAVTGLTNRPYPPHAAPAGGVKPVDVRAFYDMQPLLAKNVDGSGITVVFPESSGVEQADLDKFTSEHNLPPMNVPVKTDPSWGQVDNSDQGEADLDVEVVHEVAPGAKEIIYAGQNLAAMEQQAIKDSNGGIVSSSLGPCEDPTFQDQATALEQVTKLAADTGVTFYDASGDSGAYGCAPPNWGNRPDDKLVAMPNSSPYATSVGGTTGFFAADSSYRSEECWSNQLGFGGSGGGNSIFFSRPSWQTGPGVSNQYSNGMRQVPDVAGLADPLSGYAVVSGGKDTVIGGTSAASPLWSGITALIDQWLKSQGLPTVGFANDALYYFGRNQSSLPAPAFHDVTVGNNLFYPATQGWDYCTGWGSPDVAGLATDFAQYEQQHPRQ